MKKSLLLTAMLTGALMAGCATQSTTSFQPFQAVDLNPQVKSGQLVQKTESFFVVNDASSSMGKTYLGSSDYRGDKLDVEKDLLNRFNRTIPNIPLSSGLLSFGFGSCLSWGSTQLNQPPQKYSPVAFETAINSMQCASGGTPLADALNAVQSDLSGISGNIALIVLSDGEDDASPIPAVEELKSRYGDRLCIYTVWVGNQEDADGQATLQQMTQASGCGISTDAASISSPQAMSEFVKTVFFKAGMPVAPKALDDDQDGVINSKDKCPDTPRGAIVDKDGCWSFHGVLFDFNSDKINTNFQSVLQNAVDVLKKNPGLTVEIQGHTDSVGSVGYNEKLSERRALAVKQYLINQGVDGKRLTTIGFGKSQPAESNATDEGRAYNRRVAFKRTDK
ncbi:MAG: OmpA family protein [Methylomonas sp.]|jgi:OOP family OmpA-OmpF porin